MTRIFFSFFILLNFTVKAQTALLKSADSLYLNENYTKAITLYKTYQDQSQVYHKIARSYAAIGNYEEALNYYELTVASQPANTLYMFEYAKLLYRTKKFKKAITLFKKLTEIDATHPNYYYHLGLSLERIKDPSAFSNYRKAFQLDTTHQKAIFKMAKQFLKKRKHDSVDHYVAIGLKSYETNVELISVQAQSYYWQEYYRKSRLWFEKLIALNETSQFIHEKLSYCYAKTYEYEKAIKHAILALKYEPQNTTNLYLLGQMYHQVEDFENAEKYIKMAIEIQDLPMDSEYTKLATVLNRQQKHKEALAILKKAIRENPKNDRAHFFIASTKDKYYEDIDSKIAAYKTFKEQFPESPYSFIVDERLRTLRTEKFREAND